MYRLTLALGAATVLLCVAASCASTTAQVSDTSQIEVLRFRITKVRHAITETRETIALSQGAPYLPELTIRLADLLSEESTYHYRVALERSQGSVDALHVPQVRLLKEQAIGLYEQVLRRFPDTPLRDRALFQIGLEHRDLGNFDDMREALERLVREHPESTLRPEALLVLGNYYFDRSDLEEASNHYERIVEGPMSRVAPLAHYKLAWCHVNLGQCDRALREFERALEAAEQLEEEERARAAHEREEEESESGGVGEGDGEARATAGGEEPAASPDGGETAAAGEDEEEGDGSGESEEIDVRREALVDLVYCYTQEREPEDAVPYLRGLAHDRATYVRALGRLARRYGQSENAHGVLPAVRELLRLGAADEDRLEDARQLHTALRAVQDYGRIGEDIDRMTRTLARYWNRTEVSRDRRQRLRDEFEVYTRDLLTRAQASMERRRNGERTTYATELARGYHAYVQTFPASPERVAMLLNYADVLATAGDPYQAGRRALQAAMLLEEEDPDRQSALHNATVYFQRVREAQGASHTERVASRSALRRAAGELLRYPLADDVERSIKFYIAESLYDDGRYREAIDRLTAVAYEYPRTTESSAAAQLVLDSYHTLNDYTGLMYAGQRFLAGDGPIDDGTRASIQPILAAAEQRMLDEVSLEAAGEDGGDVGLLVRFARQHGGTQIGERALLNAFVASRAVGNTEQLYRLGDEMRQSYPGSGELSGMLATLGQVAVTRFEFERAIDYLSQSAGANNGQQLPMLLAAGELLEKLGDLDGAAERYRRAAGVARDAAGRSEPLARLAALLERRGDPQAIVRELSPYTGENVEVAARVGVAHAALGHVAEAEALLPPVLGEPTASAQALARAHYGMGEIIARSLSEYPDLTEPMLIEEYITIVDVAQESYLNAAQQGSALYTPAALGRLALVLRQAAQKLRSARVPSELSPEEAEAVRTAIAERTEALQRASGEALEACREQAFRLRAFHPAARACLVGRAPTSAMIAMDPIEPRRTAAHANGNGLAALRDRVARNPEDVDGLLALGEQLLDAGDPHGARVVFAAAIERGGGARATNLLGVASFRAGDHATALAAFAEAAEEGLEAGRQNMADALRQEGLSQAATRVMERYREGREGGRRLR